jgi:hypothetical protein
MTKIGIIGCDNASKASIEAILLEKDIKDVVVVTADELPELPKPPVFRLEAPPMGMINDLIYQDIKDGQTSRRERRRRERKQNKSHNRQNN